MKTFGLLSLNVLVTIACSAALSSEAFAQKQATPTGTPPAVEIVTSVSQVTDVKPTDSWFRSLQSLIERYGIGGLTEGKKLMPGQHLTPTAYRSIRQSALGQLRDMASSSDISSKRFGELFPTNCSEPKSVGGVMTAGDVVNSLKCIFGPSTLKAVNPDQPMTRGYFVQVLDDAIENGMTKISSNSVGGSGPYKHAADGAALKAN